jgi:hypothetical protein
MHNYEFVESLIQGNFKLRRVNRDLRNDKVPCWTDTSIKAKT